MMCMEHSYVLAVEQLLNLAVPERGQYIRVLYSEVRGGDLVKGGGGGLGQRIMKCGVAVHVWCCTAAGGLIGEAA